MQNQQNQPLPSLREASETFDYHPRPRAQGPGDASMSAGHFPPAGGYLAGGSVPPFYNHSEVSSLSPNQTHSHLADAYRTAGSGGMPAQSSQFSAMMMHNPKRPYRQRRKDPSCDACRERKVKCDATETTSCTECSSRNVRCQFTKDTNRRMSSIKQVQDLERQLLDARQQLDRLRTAENRSEESSVFSQSPTETTLELPILGKSPRRMLKAKTTSDLTHTKTQLANVGRGLLKPPVTHSSQKAPEIITTPDQELPPRHIADELIHAYLECVHRHFPVIYWPDFHHNYTALYENDTRTATKEFVGLLFAVFACGTVHADCLNPERDGQRFLSYSMAKTNFLVEETTAGQIVIAFMVSKFLFETHRKSTAWMWLGSSIRIAQDKGYHVQGGQWSAVEGEMRKRIWYSVYVWDRLLALELGKPMLIDDDDCDTEYPDALEEEATSTSVTGSDDVSNPLQPTLLLAAVHVSRLSSSLSKLSRSLCITNQTLNKFEAQLHSCLYLLPRQLQISSISPVDPFILAPVIYFQNTRLILHRHNMSPSCSAEQRSAAIGQCLYAAQDTASILSRTMMAGSAPAWEARLALSATNLLCTHLWRCMLFLIFRQQYEAYSVLLRATAAIGDRKLMNICCGRFLLFFIERLIHLHEQGKGTDLDQDEEIIVYLSADLQAGINSWVWGNAETGTLLSRRQKHGRPRHTSQEREQGSPLEPSVDWDSLLTAEEQASWGGWQRVEQATNHLKRLHESAILRHPPGPIVPAMPSANPGLSRVSASQATRGTPQQDSSRSRMNIASII